MTACFYTREIQGTNIGRADAMQTILVADDNPGIRRLLQVILSQAGECEVHAVADGGTALACAREMQPLLMILDIDMPGLTGLEVCRTLKSERATDNIPVWIITGSSEPAVVAAAITAGADGFFRKPFHPSELQARVREYTHAVPTGGVAHGT
jgi:CheY-like chemotaxis protein